MQRPERESCPAGNRTANASSTAVKFSNASVRRAAILVDEDTITIKGPAIFDTLRPVGIRPIFAGTVGGWMLHRRRLPDALAALEAAGYRVTVVEGVAH